MRTGAGHFVARVWCEGEAGGGAEWVCFDDTRVRGCGDASPISPDNYILLFARAPPPARAAGTGSGVAFS